MEDIIDIIVTETTNLIEITSQPTDEIIDVNIIDNREDITLNVTPTVVEININSLTGNFGVNWGDIEGTLSNQTDLQTVLNAKADLVDGKVPSSQLPSYVDDVVEVATYSALPVTGETGKIYITLDTNYIYRWTGSTYVEIKDSSAVWGAITGTLSNQTDLQNALNLKANDSLVVHLAGTETITGAKTFSSAVTAPNFVLSGGTGNTGLYYGHTDRVVLANYTVGGIDFEVNGGSIVATLFPSGNYGLGITLDAGYKLDVNGTARISGALSGTSASFSSSITASSLIKSGGTSSQFLKADGSVDSSTYLTTGTAASTYLPLTGGTLTGGLNGTFGNFSSYVNAQTIDLSNSTASNALRITHTNGSYHAVSIIATGNSALYASGSVTVVGTIQATSTIIAQAGLSNGAGQSFTLPSSTGTLALTSDLSSYLPLTGGTLTGALSGTSASFSGIITANSATTAANGSINIENTDPAIRFRVTGGSANKRIYEWRAVAAGGVNDIMQLRLWNDAESSASTLFSVASSGAATFSSSVTATGGLTVGSLGSGSDAIISLANNASGSPRTIYYKASTATINFTSTGGGDLVTITNGGNVGIGTTLPGNPLTVSSTIGYATEFYRNNNADSRINITNTTTTTGGDKGLMLGEIGVDSYFYNYATGSAIFGTSSTERMRITSGGSLLVGTTNILGGGGSSGGIGFNVGSSGVVINQSNGDFGAYFAKISGYTFGGFVGFYVNGSQVGSITTNGSTTSYVTSSDYRLKEDLKSINGLEIVNKIKVYDYKWKNINERMDGVLAHELAEVLPYAVTGEKDGEQMQGVDYSKIVPVLIQSIKELKAELDTLKNK